MLSAQVGYNDDAAMCPPHASSWQALEAARQQAEREMAAALGALREKHAAELAELASSAASQASSSEGALRQQHTAALAAERERHAAELQVRAWPVMIDSVPSPHSRWDHHLIALLLAMPLCRAQSAKMAAAQAQSELQQRLQGELERARQEAAAQLAAAQDKARQSLDDAGKRAQLDLARAKGEAEEQLARQQAKHDAELQAAQAASASAAAAAEARDAQAQKQLAALQKAKAALEEEKVGCARVRRSSIPLVCAARSIDTRWCMRVRVTLRRRRCRSGWRSCRRRSCARRPTWPSR